jgi:hypothetical protein
MHTEVTKKLHIDENQNQHGFGFLQHLAPQPGLAVSR